MKTIVITGATDGLGYELAKTLAQAGHEVVVHGRSQAKLDKVKQSLAGHKVATLCADLSVPEDCKNLARQITQQYQHIDVLINNAGVFKLPNPITAQGQDARIMVNTVAPYFLTQQLLPIMNDKSRVINLSSAAQAPVDLAFLQGHTEAQGDFDAYAQSKLALTLWSFQFETTRQPSQPDIVAVNPGSLLATKMVREGFGSAGKDLGIGVKVLAELALSQNVKSGQYFDNDIGHYAPAHPDTLDTDKCEAVVEALAEISARLFA